MSSRLLFKSLCLFALVSAIGRTQVMAQKPQAGSSAPVDQKAAQVEVLSSAHPVVLENPGKKSFQLLWHENAPDSQLTITRVVMTPGAISARHNHPASEQVWIVEEGTGTLLLGEAATRVVKAGDIIRTPIGAIHGIQNTGTGRLVYLAVATPPENFSQFYSGRSEKKK